MYTGTLLDSQKARNIPNGIAGGAWYQKGANLIATELQGTWLHVIEINGQAISGWMNAGANQTKIKFDVIIVNPPPPVPPVAKMGKYAIVSRIPSYFADPLAIEVNACSFNDWDNPSILKGDTIFVTPEMRLHLQKIQTLDAYNLVTQKGHLWCNRGDWKAELLTGFGNFLELTGEKVTNTKGTFYGVVGFPWAEDITKYDGNFNWFNNPTTFSKETARRKDMTIINPGNGKDAYWILLKKKPKMWIYAPYIELFPPMPPEGTGYILRGASVFMQTADGVKPLRLARTPGELLHPDPRWKLNTGSVIPEVRPEWIYPTI
jgi:hypothetical protein